MQQLKINAAAIECVNPLYQPLLALRRVTALINMMGELAIM